jgi:hypothetical protein
MVKFEVSFDVLFHGPPLHEQYLFQIPARGRYVGRYPFTTCCVTGPTPSPSPSLLLAQAIFEPNLLPLATQTILKFSHSHLPAYEDRTEYSETSAYKIQTPGNYPEENI